MALTLDNIRTLLRKNSPIYKSYKLIRVSLDKNYAVYKLFRWFFSSLTPVSIPKKYPVDINLELTTACNAKCKFCTRDALIRSGVRKAKCMDYAFAQEVIEILSKVTKAQGIPEEDISFGPVGLGEPLIYPHFFDVVKYARELFPRAHFHANTNCIALTSAVAERLVDCELDSIRLSLNFNNPVPYKKWCGVDKYDLVTQNIQYFLRIKGDKRPAATIHVLDLELNGKEFYRFKQQWTPLLNGNDSLVIERYLSLTDRSYRQGKKYPCSQLWSVLMVDVEGFVFPCCLGIWTAKDSDLCLGHITDDLGAMLAKLGVIKERHIRGEYGMCNNCAYLSEFKDVNKKFYSQVVREQVKL